MRWSPGSLPRERGRLEDVGDAECWARLHEQLGSLESYFQDFSSKHEESQSCSAQPALKSSISQSGGATPARPESGAAQPGLVRPAGAETPPRAGRPSCSNLQSSSAGGATPSRPAKRTTPLQAAMHPAPGRPSLCQWSEWSTTLTPRGPSAQFHVPLQSAARPPTPHTPRTMVEESKGQPELRPGPCSNPGTPRRALSALLPTSAASYGSDSRVAPSPRGWAVVTAPESPRVWPVSEQRGLLLTAAPVTPRPVMPPHLSDLVRSRPQGEDPYWVCAMCSSFFVADSHFCRKCGRARPLENVSEQIQSCQHSPSHLPWNVACGDPATPSTAAPSDMPIVSRRPLEAYRAPYLFSAPASSCPSPSRVPVLARRPNVWDQAGERLHSPHVSFSPSSWDASASQLC